MSRPPRPLPADALPVELDQPGRPARYLPLEHAELLALQQRLATGLLGRTEAAEGDAAATLMELSAVVGHVLSRYQNRIAGEAFLDTAIAGSSLVRHAERLAYQPDLGLAAIGHVVLTVKPGLEGEVAAGLALASTPLGESRAQDYETTEAIAVSAALNLLRPADATRPVAIAPPRATLVVEGIGHGLVPGDVVGLAGPTIQAALILAGATEDRTARRTTLFFTTTVGTVAMQPASQRPRVLVKPRAVMRGFGAVADPTLWPEAALKGATGTAAAFSGASFRYVQGSGAHSPSDVYLQDAPARPLLGEFVAAVTPAGASLLRVAQEAELDLALERTETRSVQTFTVSTTTSGSTTTSSLTPATASQTVTSSLAGKVRAVRLAALGGAVQPRRGFAANARWLGGWTAELIPAAEEPNDIPLGAEFDLPLRHPALAPGRVLVLTDAAGMVAQPARITAALPAGTTATRIAWEALGTGPAGGWRRDAVRIHANVAPISHGRSVEEELGGSDGVTARQRFTLKQAPVTMLPSAEGGVPALDLLVDEVLWTRVSDFWESGSEDRHYRLAFDEAQAATVVFGDGVRGAVPPSGRRNIVARYRVGLGPEGDAASGRVRRLKTSHPLLDAVVNPLPVAGGTPPASLDDVRRQGTRWVRSFGRAVSVVDHADVALLFSGVAAARARWEPGRGTVLTVATAEGQAPPAMAALRDFLDARRDASLPLVLQGPRPRVLAVSVQVEPDPAFLPDALERAVRAALTGLYAFRPGALGRSADQASLLAVLLAVPGVLAGEVLRFRSAAASAPEVVDIIRLAADEYAALAAADLRITLLGAAP
jgi:predicted phage baseplate assembly protein